MFEAPQPDQLVHLSCRDKHGTYRPSNPAIYRNGLWWMQIKGREYLLDRDATVVAWHPSPTPSGDA